MRILNAPDPENGVRPFTVEGEPVNVEFHNGAGAIAQKVEDMYEDGKRAVLLSVCMSDTDFPDDGYYFDYDALDELMTFIRAVQKSLTHDSTQLELQLG
jgi:hypothetical protein